MDNAPAPQPDPQPYGAEPMLRSGGGMRSIHNELDCGKVDQNCQAFVKRLMADKLSNISLDITPRYMPDLDPAEDEAKRQDQLKQADPREWKDSTGRVLASGRLLRLENGNAVIGEQDAETARLPLQQLGDDEICFIAGWYRLPAERILRDNRKDVALLRDNRQWIASTYTWHASALCHKPLYFEEAQLERYGHTAGRIRQPILSGAHFFGSMIMLPYQMAISPPWECEYSLGYYRPGSCAAGIPAVPVQPQSLAHAGWRGCRRHHDCAVGLKSDVGYVICEAVRKALLPSHVRHHAFLITLLATPHPHCSRERLADQRRSLHRAPPFGVSGGIQCTE